MSDNKKSFLKDIFKKFRIARNSSKNRKINNMWKDENGKVYIEEDLFNEALEECHSKESAYEYIDNLIAEKNLEEI